MRTIPFGKPIIGDEERNAVNEVLQGTMFVHGPKSKEFEKSFAEFTKAPNALSCASCTAGLHLAYFYLGLGEGDEVIVPAQTHVATVHAVEFVGAKPVFVDAEIETGNIDIDQIEAAITDKTKALSIVHYLGMPVNMKRIMEIAKKHNLFVVEDCALAIGTYYDGVHAGLHGDIGCYSFYPVKHMTTAEGGMMITKHDDVAAKLNKQRAFGVDRVVGERKVQGMYDVTMLGYNYRMNELEAALGVEQVKRMPGFLDQRKKNYEALEAGLKEIEGISLFKSSHAEYQSSYYCLSILLDDELAAKREDIMSQLKEKGIGTSIYYPQAVPNLTYYKEKYGFKGDEFPVATKISGTTIALSVGPHLNEDDMNYMVDCLKELINK